MWHVERAFSFKHSIQKSSDGPERVDSFILVILSKTFKFTSSVLFGTHIVLDKSLIVLQLLLHLSKLTRVYSKHFFRSVSRQKYSILNWVLKLNLQKKNFVCANKSRFYCLYIKKKTRCVSLSIYIFSLLIYKMKDEINSQIAFPQRLKMYSLTLYAV